MEKSLLLARRRMQEETASDPSSPGKMDGIAAAFGGKVAALPRRGSDKKNLISGIKESFEREETASHIPEDLAKRLAARRLAVDQAINEKNETPKEASTFPRSKNESAQLIEVTQGRCAKQIYRTLMPLSLHQARRGNSAAVDSDKNKFGPRPTISKPELAGEMRAGNMIHSTRPAPPDSEKPRMAGTTSYYSRVVGHSK
jgi:hypothetical protein